MSKGIVPGWRALQHGVLGAVMAGSVAGCALFKEKPADPEDLFVTELHRSIDCGTPDRQAGLRYFSDAAALRDWLDANEQSLGVSDADLPDGQALLLVEMGRRKTGGYFIKVSDSAYLDRDRMLWLQGTWTSPDPDRMVTQMISSPCVLLALPARDYRGFRISDQDKELRASLTLDD